VGTKRGGHECVQGEADDKGDGREHDRAFAPQPAVGHKRG